MTIQEMEAVKAQDSCPTRNAAGFTITLHVEGCPLAPYDVCSYCSHPVVAGEESDHDECREKLA